MKKWIVAIVGAVFIATVVSFGGYYLMTPPIDLTVYEYLREPRITNMPSQTVIEATVKGVPSETAPAAMSALFGTYMSIRK